MTSEFAEKLESVVAAVRSGRAGRTGYFDGLHSIIIQEGLKEGLFPEGKVELTNGMSRAVDALSDPGRELETADAKFHRDQAWGWYQRNNPS